MNEKRKVQGCWAAVITVFREDESLDLESTRRFVNFLIENGIEGLVVCGGTGEAVAMSMDEQKKVIEALVDEVNRRVPVYAGACHYRPKTVIELGNYAKLKGVDGIMVTPPWGMTPSVTQIAEYFRTIAQNIDISVMLYEIPSVTGVALTVQQIYSLVEENLIHSVKLVTGNPVQVHELKYLCKDKLTIFCGEDTCALEALLAGANGWISGLTNLIPRLSRALTDAALRGDAKETRRIWEKMLPLINMETYLDGVREPHWLSFVKSGLNIRGQKVGNPRRPLLPLREKYQKGLQEVLKEMGLISV